MAIVQRSHELGMTQAPDFIAKLVDDLSLLHTPAVPLQVLNCNDVLETASTLLRASKI